MDANIPPKIAYVKYIKKNINTNPTKNKSLITKKIKSSNGRVGSSIVETDNTSSIDETKIISHLSPFDIVSNTSQKDLINETVFDKYRCGSSSLLNAFLLLGGNFNTIANRFSLENNLSYRSIHLAQDKIYSYANTDNKEGLESSYVYSYDRQGTIKKVIAKGEMLEAAKIMGLTIKPLIGSNIKTINEKKESVNNFLEKDKGVLVVSVYLDKATGEIKSLSERENNHYVTIFKMSNQFFLADTGRSSNGKKNNLMRLEENQINNLIYNNPSIINGISIGN